VFKPVLWCGHIQIALKWFKAAMAGSRRAV